MTENLSNTVVAAALAEEDVTAVWVQCHEHLLPLAAALPVDNGAELIKVAAHIRVGGKFWFDLAQITYNRTTKRFTLNTEDRLKALGTRDDLQHLPVDAINARLWSSTPTMLNIEPTTRCNFNCWYCVGREMRQDDIKVDDFARMLDNFPTVKTIALVGEGEPLMHKGFFDMARMAKDRNIRVIIISNGSAFSQSVVKQLCETEVAYVSISIDSFDPDTFKSSRLDGDLEKVLTGIRRLRDYRDSNGYKFPKIALKGPSRTGRTCDPAESRECTHAFGHDGVPVSGASLLRLDSERRARQPAFARARGQQIRPATAARFWDCGLR